jgi:hypothetical protein
MAVHMLCRVGSRGKLQSTSRLAMDSLADMMKASYLARV